MRNLLVFTLLASILAGGAVAQDIVRENPFLGTWRCAGFGRQPVGILTITNPMYEFVAVDENWQPIESDRNGGGIMTFGAGQALPFGGPLLTVFAALGKFESDMEMMFWTGAEGFNMSCMEQVN
ncbi:hypothetical protein [Abyssibius alkaniclasticus]|uniref:hypothetical protein n=1 Tax=Abyssibius alkaniclasticus TaxID=2881234 RepID=UPI0040587C6B